MEQQDKIGFIVCILCCIGLGLMLGSEFSGRYITIIGAGSVLVSLIGMIYFCLKKK